MLERQTEATKAPVETVVFPPGLHHAYLFATFNAFSYQVVLNSPMVLYAKVLGASATVLGIIAGMMPLLVIFQIPAASYIPRLGFKRFVYAGWGTRVMFIFGMALVPLTAVFLKPESRLALMLMLLFFFNLSRGISSCAWLPWITALVPPGLRGRYLARDQAVQNLASFFTFLIAAACLAGQWGHAGSASPDPGRGRPRPREESLEGQRHGTQPSSSQVLSGRSGLEVASREPHPWQFASLFAFSAIMGAVSLSFLKRIPDAEMQEEIKASKGRVPWLEMLGYAPFKKLLRALVGYSMAYGGMTAFTVAFLKTEAGMSETNILLVTSVAFLGGLCSLWFLGSRLDRLGSKPVLTFCFAMWLAVLAGWMSLSGGILPVKLVLVLILQFLMGLLAALVQMSNTRLAMAVIPVMGRTHFFAIYSVVGNVTLGLAPIGWGLLIDAVGSHSPMWLGLAWTRYTVFYAAAGLVFLVTLALARLLDEPQAASMEELLREILIQSPQRFWLRFWPRGGA